MISTSDLKKGTRIEVVGDRLIVDTRESRYIRRA
jgi:hypothetical protein